MELSRLAAAETVNEQLFLLSLLPFSAAAAAAAAAAEYMERA